MDELTLRDEFAIAAITGGYARDKMPDWELKVVFDGKYGITRNEMIAADAYQIADELLKERLIKRRNK